MSPEFRLARPADAPPLRGLIERAYRGDSARQGWTNEADLLDDERTSDPEVAGLIVAADKRVLVAEQAGALIGTVTATDLGGGRAYLGMLCVEPTLQAAGLGRDLIARIEQIAARDFGAAMMEMTVIELRPELIRYYERRGYRDTGERRPFPVPYPVDFAMVVLERAIG
ncbi:GNAT family N-acetyltransferase [Novosphingobium sp. Chol11]|uniref:GNAT family N-acetyltransferase n=1 Tax=Novosphingobium sp. Chol11 TaxID=1385763 RepID=UPI0025FD38D2|nr:GNAT family N-acetyltransferase [Novosphingobium sp. Chol11]